MSKPKRAAWSLRFGRPALVFGTLLCLAGAGTAATIGARWMSRRAAVSLSPNPPIEQQGEVVADMQHSSGQGETGLVAYWTFDEATDIGRSIDLSGHGNDVTFGDGVASLMPLRVPSDLPFGG